MYKCVDFLSLSYCLFTWPNNPLTQPTDKLLHTQSTQLGLFRTTTQNEVHRHRRRTQFFLLYYFS
jgi:hypothetical protein